MLAAFAFLGIGALVFLGAYQQIVSKEAQVYGSQVIVWGTQEALAIEKVFAAISGEIEPFGVVDYKRISEATFDEEFVNAVAEGRSPDLIILSSDKLVKHRSKLFTIPYENVPQREYKDTYIDGADIFAFPEGIYAMPFAVDPIVQYWNKDIFASNGLAESPRSWEELVNLVVPNLTIRDQNRNVQQSAVSFGEFRNVTHAKDILMMLALQSGSRMVYEDEGLYLVELDVPIQSGARPPLSATLQFYTDFSNANSPLYSWNRAMSTDKNAFLSGDLALYYGLGSEYEELYAKNPNLNFDISVVPQGNNATIRRTAGTLYGFAIPKGAGNSTGAYAAMQTLLTPAYAAQLAQNLRMSSTRRDVIAAGDENPVRQVLLNSALIMRGWLDPEPSESDAILMQMVEDVVSNRLRINESVDDAVGRLILEY